MKIKYEFDSKIYTFEQLDKTEISKLNFLLTNQKGDYLNLGINKNSCKYQGFSICKHKTIEMFKILDEIVLSGYEVSEVQHKGHKIIRTFKSNLAYEDENNTNTQTNEKQVSDSFFIGPTGGMIYEIKNYYGTISIDLDMRKKNDFDRTHRDYKIIKENGAVIVEFTKTQEKGKYKLYFGIHAPNFDYKLKEEKINKEYSYTRLQKSDWKEEIFRLMNINILNNKRIIIGAGFTKSEVLEQIKLLSTKSNQLESIKKEEINQIYKNQPTFEKPLTQNIKIAYDLSKQASHDFLKKELDNTKVGIGSFAGFPYFTNIWSKDDIFSLKAFINVGEYGYVKSRINFYLKNIDKKTGGLKNLLSRDTSTSCDILFMLTKRVEDQMFILIEENLLYKIYKKDEINYIYDKLNLAFNRIVKFNWDFEEELIRVKNKNSFRDSEHENFPLNVQIMFASFVSFMAFLAKITKNNSDSEKFLDFENLLSSKIRNTYLKNNMLHNNQTSNKPTPNVFLVYYFYSKLLDKNDWEQIFDSSLKHLRTNWGSISSMSKMDKDFHEEHSGVDRQSREKGDTFFWMNNLTAIALNNLNEKKYRDTISKIIMSSTNDILIHGTIGFGSELSSSIKQKAEGNLAQFSSTSTYLEMIDYIFEKK